MPTPDFWRKQYAAALATAGERARDALFGPNPWRLALGFTNSVDRIVTLDGAHLAALAADLAGPDPLAPLPNPDHAATPGDFVRSLLYYIRTGRGSEVWLDSPDLGAWIAATFQGRAQVGGTGVRAANTLARLGFPSLLHVTSLGPEQASLIDDSGRILIPTANGLVTPGNAIRPDDPIREHFIFEFQAGLTVPLASGPLVAPEANRVIVSRHPGNLDHPIDHHFVAAVADPEARIPWVLVSGFSQVDGVAMARARISETLAAIRQWRRKPDPPRVHLELGAMPDPETFAIVRDYLVPAVDSLGLNEDELTATLTLAGQPPPDGFAAMIAGLDQLQRRHDVPRLGLHTRHCCITITEGDPLAEQSAQLYASAVAASFARLADFPTPTDLEETVATGTVSTTGLGLIASLADLDIAQVAPGIARLSDRWLVVAPTLAISHPAATIGLGDSFTGGLLPML